MTDYQTQRVLSDIQSHIASLDDRLLRSLATRTRPIDLLWKSLAARFRNVAQPKGENAFAAFERDADRTALEMITRATSAPAMTTVATWAQELIGATIVQWIEGLQPQSLFAQLAAQSLAFEFDQGSVVKVPGRTATPMINGSFVGEGQPIPVRKLGLNSISPPARKVGVISTFSREVSRGSDGNIERCLRSEITRDTALTVDGILIDANPADGVRPAGLRNGISGLTPAAAGQQAMVTDFKALIGAVQPAGRVALLVNAVQAAGIASIYDAASPIVLSSASVPAGLVIAIDLDSFVSSAGLPVFDVSSEAVIHEDDAPLPLSATGAPATIAAPERSLYQTDVFGIRQIWFLNWSMRRAAGVSWMTGVNW
jgi:HK97 family phage major capsid protein